MNPFINLVTSSESYNSFNDDELLTFSRPDELIPESNFSRLKLCIDEEKLNSILVKLPKEASYLLHLTQTETIGYSVLDSSTE